MIKNPLFITMFATLVAVAMLNKLALLFSLYWTTYWFDILMHLLGGFWVALATLWIISLMFPRLLQAPKIQVFIATVLILLIVGLLWEAFELYFGISKVFAPDFVADTITDIIMDIVGAVFAFIYAYPKIKPTTLQTSVSA